MLSSNAECREAMHAIDSLIACEDGLISLPYNEWQEKFNVIKPIVEDYRKRHQGETPDIYLWPLSKIRNIIPY
jgi:hypothetical protein